MLVRPALPYLSIYTEHGSLSVYHVTPKPVFKQRNNDWAILTNQPSGGQEVAVVQNCYLNGEKRRKSHNPRSLQCRLCYLGRTIWMKVCIKPNRRISLPLLARVIFLINVTFSGLISEQVTRVLLDELCFPRTVWHTLLQSDRGRASLTWQLQCTSFSFSSLICGSYMFWIRWSIHNGLMESVP